ncbi:FKBP-type peptidyl-prolyl cis-trans isomerase [Sphingomonas sp. dw_22]|uniref:FKBP-type peptidyl-prolyl cis-trans isomerase n=1 Tax=Sphingomonas sp. dw_22 TaxID=2721175 RepID=UPI001BD3B36B|nr:FKBP-type peptidyl-prolyl cis-trans isomerase [Sphingomonas sp. dw_22]
MFKLMPFAALALVCAAGTAVAQDAPAEDHSQDAAWHNRQMLALASLKPSDGWRSLQGGLRWRRIKGDGSGRHPTLADQVTIHYAGSFIDGTEFDSSYGGEPATFPLGRLVEAWQIAVPLMGVGDTVEIAVPAELGYGTQGKGPIPGDATLMFKIELLGIAE